MSAQNNKHTSNEYSNNYTAFKNSKNLEKWNYSIFLKKLQNLDEKAIMKKEQSFFELYEEKKRNFQKKLNNLFKNNTFLNFP